MTELTAKDMGMMQLIIDGLEDVDEFIEQSKKGVSPILDIIWEHYHNNYHDMDKDGHAMMLGMALKHDAGRKWSLFDVVNALQYAKTYIVDKNTGG